MEDEDCYDRSLQDSDDDFLQSTVKVFFLHIQFTLFQTKIYSHQVLIYLNVRGIPVRKPLQNRRIVEEQLDM